MKKILFLLLLTSASCFSIFANSASNYPNTNRVKQSINLDWKFSKMSDQDKPVAIDFDDSKWEGVSIPHNPDPVSLALDSIVEDWKMENAMRDYNWYRKELFIELSSEEKAYIEFEGVHNATELYVNGDFVGRYAVNGYIPHHFDITPFVKSGQKNTIAVLADNSFNPLLPPDPHQTDYVKFGGIYRDVYLVKTHTLHVGFNWESFDAGVHITTPTVKKNNGTVSVKTTVKNAAEEAADCRIETMIVDADGLVLKKMLATHTIGAKQQFSFRQTTEIVDDYRLWSPSQPYLYRAVSVIYKDDEAVDVVDNTFGFRSLELVDGQGLLLNGEPFFMLGLNRHQNYPHIGDAVPNSMHYEAALRYKQAGINTIRLSHYPQDDSFIEACDELGILLYEEPSTWIGWQEGQWMATLEESLRVMVRNHRNHPSIAIWGAGINHRGPVPQLNNAAKEEDPYRLTASASSPWNGIKNAGVTDIYATMDYRQTDFPEEGFCMVMEHGFSDNSQGHQHHISRYKKRKNNIGALLWVGAAYNRFQPTTVKPELVSEYGLQTAYRVPRPAYYWYISENTDAPFVHIADETVYKNEKIHVYSNATKVALYADGQLVAIQSPDADPLRINNEHPSFTFHYAWTDEEITAKALNNGMVVASHSRQKQGEAYALKLSVDNPQFPLSAGGSDLKMVRAYVVDRHGEVVTNDEHKVHFDVKGAGEILYADKDYVDQMQAWEGVATVYIKGTKDVGELQVKATSAKLKSASMTLETVPYEENTMTNSVLYDYPNFKVDIQQENQLEQFGWRIAHGGEADGFSYKSEICTFELSANSELKWRPGTYAIVGGLPFMACDGVYIEEGEMILTLKDLPKGHYQLKTYHHSFEDVKKLFPYNIKVDREDANGAYSFVSDDEAVGVQDARDIGERNPTSVTNYIVSDGVHPVTLTLKIDGKGKQTWLNGFEFRQVNK